MSDNRTDMDERSILAAEYALGILTGDEARRARALAASDASFREEVARWTGRFAPLLDQVPAVEPPAQLWARIVASGRRGHASDNVVALRRRLRLWRASAVGMAGLAACLALILLVQAPGPGPVPVEPVPSRPMVAVVGDEQEAKLLASWDPDRRQLVMAVSGELPRGSDRSHELWVIPSGGKPVSLGTLSGSDQSHIRLAEALAQLMREGATIAISIEPRGGSPTGAPTGPVVATGPLKGA